MNEQKRTMARTIIIGLAVMLAVTGCTDLYKMAEDVEEEYNEDSVSTDANKLAEDYITYAAGDSESSVTSAFTLSTTGDAGSTITWSSSNTDVVTINEDGSTTITRPSGSSAVVELTATITKGTVTTTKTISVTVLAREVVNHTVTFNANDGSGSVSSQTIQEGATANLTANTFTRTGHTFSGWATAPGGSAADYADGAAYVMGSADVILYAVWTALPASSYAITFNANGGSGSMGSQTVLEGATATLATNAFTKADHTFAGWATAAGGTVDYVDGASYTMGSSNVTLYAVWAAITHTITFNANGGSGSMSNQTVAQNTSVNLTSNTFTRTGHTFAGWATTAAGNVAYADQGSYTMGSSNVTLYAVWAAVTHTITFNANDGDGGSMSDQTIAQGASANLNANAFTRTGYTFAGWDDDSDGVVDYADGALYTMGNSDVTLDAVWRANLSIDEITPDGESAASPDTNIVIVFSDSLDGTTKGTVSFASPAITFTDGVNASITFSTTNSANDTITINPDADLEATNHTSITVSGFKDSYSTDVNTSDSTYYFPVRGAMDLYFPFTNGSLEDASGRGVTLVKFGDPTKTTGHDGSADGAYIFDGAGDYMQVVGDLGISAGDDFTISAWIKLDPGFLNFNAIVSNYHNNGLKALMFRVNSSWNGHTNALDLAEGYSNDNVLSTGVWLHVVGVYINATRQVRFYVDGSAAGTGTTPYTIEDQTTQFAIGGDYLNVTPRYFKGTIDEVRFYKYALDATEVGNLYYNDDINDTSRP